MSFVGGVVAAFEREVRHVRTSGWDIFLLAAAPLLAIVTIAAVFHSGVIRSIPIAVVDMDGSGLSRAIERDLLSHPKIHVVATPSDLSAAAPLLRSGRVYSVVYLPSGLEVQAQRRERAAVIIYFNSAIQTVGSQAGAAAQAAVQAAVSRNVAPLRVGESEAGVRLMPPRVQVTVVGNPEQSFELFLQSLATPLTLNVLLACATVFAVGRELSAATLAELGAVTNGRWGAALVGKLAPYVLVFWGWTTLFTAYLAGWRGWDVEGSVPMLLGAQLAFLCSTSAISAFLVVMTRAPDTALSLAALFFGSAMSFASGTLPVNDAPLFTRIWSAVLPSTSYIRIQEEQLVLGSSAWRSAPSLGLLFLFAATPFLVAVLGLRRLSTLSAPAETLSAPSTPPGFLASFLQTLRVVVANKPIKSTILASVVMYGFYYPLAYKVQTVVKLPVAVTDLDRSPWSRSFLRKLDATREVHIATRTDSARAAQTLLQEDKVDAAVIIPRGLEAGLLKGSPGGIAAYLKGAYLVRVRFVGQAVSGAVHASLTDVMAPWLATGHLDGPRVEVVERPLYNVSNGYGGYAVPGAATIILQATLLFGVAMFMGLKRERDTWRMSPSAFAGIWAAFTLLGSLTSFFWFGFVFWFQDYPRGGDMAGLLLAVPVFAAAVSALALLVGSLFERHERSMEILAGTSVPFFFLAGLSWPGFAMPPFIQALAKLIPSTSAVLMFVKLNSMGASLGEVAPELTTLVFLAFLYAGLALLRVSGQGPASTEAAPKAVSRHRPA